MKVRISNTGEHERHKCTSWAEGEWIFFQCSTCTHRRKLNTVTGKMITIQRGSDALHSGSHQPVFIQPPNQN